MRLPLEEPFCLLKLATRGITYRDEKSPLFALTDGYLDKKTVASLTRSLKLDANVNRKDNIPLLKEFALHSDKEWHSL